MPKRAERAGAVKGAAPRQPPAAARPRRPVTLRAIAQAAGCSAAAVSSFLSGRYYGLDRRRSIGISPALRAHLLTTCRRMRYRPDDPAVLARIYPEEGDFAFLLDDAVADGVANPYYSRMLRGLAAAAAATRAHILFAQFNASFDYLACDEALPKLLSSGRATKCALAGAPNYSLLLALQRRGLAAVYLSRAVSLPGIVSVVPDHADAARQGVRRLLELGHRRILIAAEPYFLPGAYFADELTRGVAEAMAAAGVPFNPSDVVRGTTPADARPNPFLMALRARRPRPTAAFCFNDITALGLVRAALAGGLRVPQDLSVIGCQDDQPAVAAHPFLSTVHFPGEEIGARAAGELAAAFDRQPDAPARRIVLPVRLVERETTAPAAHPPS